MNQGEVFPSMQRYYSSFSIYSLSCYMFRSYDHLQTEIHTSEIILLLTDPLFFTILVNVIDNNFDVFLVIVDVVAVAALTNANCWGTF
jgi:hypothetical protein